jgi:hypothetical protein
MDILVFTLIFIRILILTVIFIVILYKLIFWGERDALCRKDVSPPCANTTESWLMIKALRENLSLGIHLSVAD